MKIALIGYGKMGKEIEKIAISRGHTIVCTIDMGEAEKFESTEFATADVAIEFTSPESAFDNYLRAFAVNVPVVSGSTGWLAKLDEVKRLCNEEGKTFFYASNFSLGVNLFFALNAYLAKLMNQFPDYSVSLEEIHHTQKVDAPSGTAITLVADIIENLDRKETWVLTNSGKEITNTPVLPSEKEIGIKAYREGDIPGIHTVVYQSDVDSIRITHDAKNRIGFALGAVLAAEFTAGKKGFLGMKDMLKF